MRLFDTNWAIEKQGMLKSFSQIVFLLVSLGSKDFSPFLFLGYQFDERV